MYPCGKDFEYVKYPGSEDCCEGCVFQTLEANHLACEHKES